MSDKILFLPGDGIGPSVMEAAEEVLRMTTNSVEIVHGEVGLAAYESTGSYLPHDTLDLLDEIKTVICGPTVPPESGTDPVESLKTQLDLFAKARLFKNLAPDLGVEGMDVTLWSSNNNVNAEITEVPDMDGVTLSKYIKSQAYNRMMNKALNDVEIRKLTNIACLGRDDFFPQCSTMFRETFDSLFSSDEYSVRHMNVTDWMTHVVKDPLRDSCIVCIDLYSAVVGGALSGLTGFDHISPTCFLGDEYSMYKPCTAVHIPNENKYANPTSAIMSVSTILWNMNMRDESRLISDALSDAYINQERTPDVGGTLTTKEFTDCIISMI